MILVFLESDLTADLLNQPVLFKRRYVAWALEDKDNIGAVLKQLGRDYELKGHLGIIMRALEFSDDLTRWLRGGIGWTAGPKPDMKLHDFAEGFQPQWKRKPLTPEMLVQ